MMLESEQDEISSHDWEEAICECKRSEHDNKATARLVHRRCTFEGPGPEQLADSKPGKSIGRDAASRSDSMRAELSSSEGTTSHFHNGRQCRTMKLRHVVLDAN